MLFSDFLIETSYMELHDNILEGKIDVSEVEVIKDSPTEYKAQFYVDEHEVIVSIYDDDADEGYDASGSYDIEFTVDGSLKTIIVGARAALVIVRGITKVVSDYLIANKSKVKAVTFEADDRRGRQGVYNILGKSIEAHGYLDYSFTYPDQRKQYVYINRAISNYYSVINAGGKYNYDLGIEDTDILVKMFYGYYIIHFTTSNLDNSNAEFNFAVNLMSPSSNMQALIEMFISNFLNAALTEWIDKDIYRLRYKNHRSDYSHVVDDVMKDRGYVIVDRNDITIYERKK